MTTIRTNAPRSGNTTYHRDGTVSLWDVYRREWIRTDDPRAEVLASLYDDERARVMRHTGMVAS